MWKQITLSVVDEVFWMFLSWRLKCSFVPYYASAILPAQLINSTCSGLVDCRLHALDSCYFALFVEVLLVLRRTSCVTNCYKKDFNFP
jgi:hypothetical protein